MANDFGTLLYELIQSSGLTAEDFAVRVGVAPGTISKAKNGRAPSAEILAALEDWILVLKPEPKKAEKLREYAHLARSTEYVREMVSDLRKQALDDRAELVNVRSELADLRLHVANLLTHLRAKGVDIPKGFLDR